METRLYSYAEAGQAAKITTTRRSEMNKTYAEIKDRIPAAFGVYVSIISLALRDDPIALVRHVSKEYYRRIDRKWLSTQSALPSGRRTWRPFLM